MASLAAAGCDPVEEETTTTATTGMDPTTSTTDAPTSTSTAGDDTTTGTTAGDETTDTGPSTEDTAGDETVGTTGEDCGSPVKVKEVTEVCRNLASAGGECYETSDYCIEVYATYCQYDIDQAMADYGEDCANAYIAYFECLTALSCEEIMGKDPVCEAEDMAIMDTCMAAIGNAPMKPLRKRIRRR